MQGGGKSLNNRAVMLHLLDDVLGWVAVLVGSILIHFTGWYIIDPLLSLVVAAFILYNVVGNLKRVFRVFLQSTPEGFDYDDL
ncbi:cation transporter [Geofilum sp. OHC36d9]|uniref:cation transporter n=1 Tax=Geofilum sp. OHC36d9 TaxID=3458413 RepID=UPI0040349845